MSGRDYTGILVKEGMEENTVLKSGMRYILTGSVLVSGFWEQSL